MAQQKEIMRPSSEFSPQQVFFNKFFLAIGKLSFLENSLYEIKLNKFEEFKIKLYEDIQINELSEPEQDLIFGVLDIFSLKHGLGSQKILREQLSQKPTGKMIGFIGPLGVAKTVMAKSLCHDLDVRQATVEPYDKNPFWKASQDQPESYDQFMLRSQIYYLISNINADIRTRLNSKINISDTSTLTDILMWAKWYYQTGRFNDKEYQAYQSLVDLLKPIIPKPDLIVALKPDTIDHLKEGVRQRAMAEPARRGELMFAEDDNQDLAVEVDLMDEITGDIEENWKIPILKFTVDPRTAFKNPEVRYDIIYQIKGKIEMLGNLLKPPPKEVAKKVIHLLSKSDEKQVILIHSKSMFSGKTTAECIIAEILGTEFVSVFQPKAALRPKNKGFEDQQTKVISRDGLRLNAQTIEDNSLATLKKYIEDNIDPKVKPYIFIDEIMLFIAHANSPKEVILILDDLRKMGFHLILDGIDYTFQGKKFTFMFNLLEETKSNPNWQQVMTSTRCRYCNKEAKGTRRWKITNSTKTIVDFDDTTFKAGDSEYEPVCCEEHASCVRIPSQFIKEELPV